MDSPSIRTPYRDTFQGRVPRPYAPPCPSPFTPSPFFPFLQIEASGPECSPCPSASLRLFDVTRSKLFSLFRRLVKLLAAPFADPCPSDPRGAFPLRAQRFFVFCFDGLRFLFPVSCRFLSLHTLVRAPPQVTCGRRSTCSPTFLIEHFLANPRMFFGNIPFFSPCLS